MPGEQGLAGIDGFNGWSPILALVADGDREVLKLVGWTGGAGTKPTINTVNCYIGINGFTDAANAVDIKGSQANLNAISEDIIPRQTGMYSLGTPTHRWKDLYIGDNSIYFFDDAGLNRTKLSIDAGTLEVVLVDVDGNPLPGETPEILFSPWKEVGTNGAITYNDGNVGIDTGEDEPTHTLEVNGTLFATTLFGDASGLTNLPAGPEGPTGPEGLQGPQGIQGETGPRGIAGTDGDSAYASWLYQGNSGSEADFLASLEGDTGPVGPQGQQGEVGDTPAKIINLWGGTIAEIPAGWALCDGNNGTPDISNYFIGDTVYIMKLEDPGIISLVKLTKTGQTTSYYTDDDGALRKGVAWPEPRFLDHGNGTITDNLTGLMWERWASRTTKTWTEAIDYCNTLSLSGYTDWKLPNINELESLVNSGESSVASWLDAQGFDINQGWNNYWSSTTAAYNTSIAWGVDMQYGCVNENFKTFSGRYALAVRIERSSSTIGLPATGQTTSYYSGDDSAFQTGVEWPSPRFIDNSDGTVTDKLTGLMWERIPSGTKMSWTAALDYANNYGLAGYTDWRLPNRIELKSLINYGQSNPASWLNTQGFSNVQADTNSQASWYWSSTTHASRHDDAWPVIMDKGSVYNGYVKWYSYNVWVVRLGQ